MPGKIQNLKWKCWLGGVQKTETNVERFTSRDSGKASLLQPWWSVRSAVPTFDVNRCNLPGLMFRSCLLGLGLAETGKLRLKISEREYTVCRGSHNESRIKQREFLPSGKITILQSSYKLGPRLRCQWPFLEHFRVEYTTKEHALPSAFKLAVSPCLSGERTVRLLRRQNALGQRVTYS